MVFRHGWGDSYCQGGAGSVAIGVLTKTFPPEFVDAVIDEAQAREQQQRSLPARLATYFTLAMCGCGSSAATRKCYGGWSTGWSGAGPAARSTATARRIRRCGGYGLTDERAAHSIRPESGTPPMSHSGR